MKAGQPPPHGHLFRYWHASCQACCNTSSCARGHDIAHFASSTNAMQQHALYISPSIGLPPPPTLPAHCAGAGWEARHSLPQDIGLALCCGIPFGRFGRLGRCAQRRVAQQSGKGDVHSPGGVVPHGMWPHELPDIPTQVQCLLRGGRRLNPACGTSCSISAPARPKHIRFRSAVWSLAQASFDGDRDRCYGRARDGSLGALEQPASRHASLRIHGCAASHSEGVGLQKRSRHVLGKVVRRLESVFLDGVLGELRRAPAGVGVVSGRRRRCDSVKC